MSSSIVEKLFYIRAYGFENFLLLDTWGVRGTE